MPRTPVCPSVRLSALCPAVPELNRLAYYNPRLDEVDVVGMGCLSGALWLAGLEPKQLNNMAGNWPGPSQVGQDCVWGEERAGKIQCGRSE